LTRILIAITFLIAIDKDNKKIAASYKLHATSFEINYSKITSVRTI
jgi:hypothetical protein